MPDKAPYGDLSILEQEVLRAVQKPGRLGVVTGRVNERAGTVLSVTEQAVVKTLCDLHERGLVTQGRGGWWHRSKQGVMAEQAAAVHSIHACEPTPRSSAEPSQPERTDT